MFPNCMVRFAAVAFLLGSFAFAQNAAITQDPPVNAKNPASMEEWSVPSHGASMNAVLYVAAGADPRGVVILLHGFPGYERNFDLAQSIRRAGWDVLVFHYRGVWGSPGDFSFSNAMQDTEAAVQYVRSPEIAAKYRIDTRRIVLIGHSMGGFMAAYAASRDPQIAAVGLLAAWNIGPTGSKPEEKKMVLTGFASEMGPLRGCTPESLFAEIEAHRAEWDFKSYAPALKSRPVLVLTTNDFLRAEDDALSEAIVKSGGTRVKNMHFDTDHGFSDKRIAMQSAVLEWLGSL